MDATLSMLKGASPNEIDGAEEEEIFNMEETCKEMGTLIEKKILETERRKDDLSDMNDKFLQALQMYQQLMKEPMQQPAPPPPPQQQLSSMGGYMTAHRHPHHPHMYQGMSVGAPDGYQYVSLYSFLLLLLLLLYLLS